MPEPEGFRWTLLGDVARLESGHTPSRAHPEYWDGDIPWVGIPDATENHGRIITNTHQLISQAGLDNSSARLLPPGTVCLSRTASVGYVVQMGSSMATSQDFVNWVCEDRLIPDYLRYLLMSEQEAIRRVAFGTTHQTMYYPDAKALHVLIPSRDVQRAIVEVLGALDDKIAANRRVERTLDDLATVLVLRSTGMTTSTVDRIAQVAMGSSPRGESLNETRDGIAFHQGIRDFGFRIPLTRVFTTAPVRMADEGDILLSVRAPVGAVNRADRRLCIGRGIAALRSTTGTPHTLFHTLRGARATWAPFNGEGTVFGSINQASLLGVTVPWVDDLEHLQRLEAELEPLEDRIDRSVQESHHLAHVRDMLLPHLMSGRITVRQAVALVEEVL